MCVGLRRVHPSPMENKKTHQHKQTTNRACSRGFEGGASIAFDTKSCLILITRVTALVPEAEPKKLNLLIWHFCCSSSNNGSSL